ncbi:hypothetical protein PPTG_01492 [Phytophthora nicotianae INRA-310]|uniref:RxLR effector protein n=1 Tax=Phytophthora nicotianae (strain INRA-310) TaxID=761204 RepID=W2R957_PHYN3|nr:hypothetical protein PPTG_01492 [Phytophthora nicotianae INRA-310]ETN21244.1 hypothetical protein PPTG_01492 [Phytophthora nicotianae INRA-310]
MCFWRPLSAPAGCCDQQLCCKHCLHSDISLVGHKFALVCAAGNSCSRSLMRVLYVFLAATAALLVNSAVESATPAETKTSKLVSGGNEGNLQKRNLRRQIGFLEWPEELEEFVHHHHHIREVFTRWCLEDHEPKEAMEDLREERDPAAEMAYKKYMPPTCEDFADVVVVLDEFLKFFRPLKKALASQAPCLQDVSVVIDDQL